MRRESNSMARYLGKPRWAHLSCEWKYCRWRLLGYRSIESEENSRGYLRDATRRLSYVEFDCDDKFDLNIECGSTALRYHLLDDAVIYTSARYRGFIPSAGVPVIFQTTWGKCTLCSLCVVLLFIQIMILKLINAWKLRFARSHVPKTRISSESTHCVALVSLRWILPTGSPHSILSTFLYVFALLVISTIGWFYGEGVILKVFLLREDGCIMLSTRCKMSINSIYVEPNCDQRFTYSNYYSVSILMEKLTFPTSIFSKTWARVHLERYIVFGSFKYNHSDIHISTTIGPNGSAQAIKEYICFEVYW